MTAPPARPHLGFRPTSHFSIITAAQTNSDWTEDDAWDSGSDDDKPLSPPSRKSNTATPAPPTPSRNGTLSAMPTISSGLSAGSAGLSTSGAGLGTSSVSTALSPLRLGPNSSTAQAQSQTAPIPFRQPSGPTSLNTIRANNLRKPTVDLNPPSIGSGTPNSTSSNAELSFSYTHVHAPSPSSYPPAQDLNNLSLAETASIGGNTTTTTTDDEGRASMEVPSPKGRGWMFIKGHRSGKELNEEHEREKEGYRKWEMSASGSVDFGGIIPDAPESESDDGGMVVGDLDVDVYGGGPGDIRRGRNKGEEKTGLDFARASEERKGKEKEADKTEVSDELDDERTPREKEGIDAIREDADEIVADPFSVIRRSNPYGHESGYNNKPPPPRQSPSHVKSPERPTDSPSKRSSRTSSVRDRPASGSGAGVGLNRGRSVRTNRRHTQFVDCLSREDINMTELKKLAWSGVPPHLRPIVWPLLLGYIPLPSSTRLQTLQRKREEFRNLVKITFEREGLDQDIWRQIKKDVPRTRPGVRLWMEAGTHQSLERILYVWAIRHPASGYVQGINDLVTPFYQIFLSAYIDADPENYDPACLPPHILNAIEADSFWCFSRLLDGIQDNYISQQPGIHRSVKRMAELVKRIDAPLAAHFESQSVEFMQFAFRWMNCLLMREISVKNTIRMWDTYLAEGADAFSQFHLYVCSAFLVKWSEKLRGMDFQGIIMFLQALPTQSWTDHEIELLLSEAFLLSSVWHNAQSHFG